MKMFSFHIAPPCCRHFVSLPVTNDQPADLLLPITTSSHCPNRRIALPVVSRVQKRGQPMPASVLLSSHSFPLFTMWSPLFTLLVLAGLTACCVSLPQIQYVNDKPYHLMQRTECRGGKIYEIDDVQDIDECKAACFARNCRAVNLFQVGEFRFRCEILAYVHGYIPAQGAACYISYY